MRNCIKTLTGFVALFMTQSVWAHPGHGTPGSEENVIIHYVSEPVHIFSFVSIVFIVLLFKYLYSKKKSEKSIKA